MTRNPNDRYRTIRTKANVAELMRQIPPIDASHTYAEWAREAKEAGYPLCEFCIEPLPRSEWQNDRCKVCQGVAAFSKPY